MATAGEMSHLMALDGKARARFAYRLMQRETRQQVCLACNCVFDSTRNREWFCNPVCCVTYFASSIRADSKPLQTEELLGQQNVPLQPPASNLAGQTQDESSTCTHCSKPFVSRKPNARFCSPKCRVYSHRKNNL